MMFPNLGDDLLALIAGWAPEDPN